MILIAVVCVLACITMNARAQEHPAEPAYAAAKDALQELKQHPKKQQFRHNWEKIVKKFRRIVKKHPKHKRAVDALYNLGMIYTDIAGISGIRADLKSARSSFGDIAEKFPSHRYADDALFYMAELSLRLKEKKAARKYLSRIITKYPKGDFLTKAKEAISPLGGVIPVAKKKTPEPQKKTVVKQAATKKKKPSKAKKATEEKPAVIQRLSISSKKEVRIKLRLTALPEKLHQGMAEESETKPKRYFVDIHPAIPSSKIKSKYKVSSKLVASVRTGRFDASTVRVVIGLKDASAQYSHNIECSNKSCELVITISAPAAKKPEPVTQPVVAVADKKVASPNTKEAPTKTIEKKTASPVPSKTPATAKTEAPAKKDKPVKTAVVVKPAPIIKAQKPEEKDPLEEAIAKKVADKPQKKQEPKPPKKKDPPAVSKKKTTPPKAKAVAKQTKPQKKTAPKAEKSEKKKRRRGLRTVVIDAGHGGKDFGAIGKLGTREKHIALKITKKVKAALKKALPGVKVILTRTDDHYLKLKERTDIANKHDADLFISIHCNATLSRKVHGVSTYFLNMASDNYAGRLANRENQAHPGEVDDLSFILADLATTANTEDSIKAATYVQKGMLSKLKKEKYSHIKDRRVNSALFYVLLNARMPSILVETSFISNYREEKRLRSSRYQRTLAAGIVKGIVRYHKYLKAQPRAGE